LGKAELPLGHRSRETVCGRSRISSLFLSAQFGKDIEPLLVHSQAILRDPPAENDAVEEQEAEGERTSAQAWFSPRKKSLLAPFGVGTVDQALMSVLQTKHFFVRLLGLSHKVIIFDEVHAYDAYMSELFERLLIWLRQINASVIVLSATLPEKTRQRLVRAYTGNATILPARNYPRLTFAASDGRIDTVELTPPDEKKLEFDWIDREAENIIERLDSELSEGGCAVVICNTVSRAQNLYKMLRNRPEKLCDDDDLILFHARFPMAWREELEQKVLKKFGPNDKDKSRPNPNRPTKAIVIATQVVEQSLDLDFDVMISDHAPIDLLLQRAGRLQRHAVNNPRQHPYRLLIAAPEVDRDIPEFERGDKFVYDEYVLLRSWIVLNKIAAKQIILPTDLPALIEQVYGDIEPTDDPKLLEALAKAKGEMAKNELGMKVKARKRLIVKPDNEDLLWGDNAALEEDNPSVHETFQALTRADRPGINVVCLHRINGQLGLEPDDLTVVFDPAQKMEKAIIRELAQHAVNVRHPDPEVERYLLAEPDDAQVKAILNKWKKVAALRYHRVAIFENGVCPLKGRGYVMRLNKQDKLGLRIEKETQ
jgi:CRISPR-associated endonuclease/helicase Cas3